MSNLKPKLPDTIREAVLADVDKGMPHAEAALKHGVGLSSVYRWARQQRGPLSKGALPDEKVRELERALAAAEQRIQRMRTEIYGSYEPKIKKALLALFLEGHVDADAVSRATGLPVERLNDWRKLASSLPPAGERKSG